MKNKRTQKAISSMPKKGEVHLLPLDEDHFVMVRVKYSSVGDDGSSSWCRIYDTSLKINVEQGTLHILPLDENRLLLLYADAENEARFLAGDENALFAGGGLEGSFIIETEDDEPILSSVYRYLPQKLS